MICRSGAEPTRVEFSAYGQAYLEMARGACRSTKCKRSNSYLRVPSRVGSNLQEDSNRLNTYGKIISSYLSDFTIFLRPSRNTD